MDTYHVFGLEIIHRLVEMIEEWASEFGLDSLEVESEISPRTLLEMCDRIARKADEWPDEKLFMRIGYVQGVMVSLNICGIKKIREIVHEAHLGRQDYIDLLDHNDPDSPFNLELGGSG